MCQINYISKTETSCDMSITVFLLKEIVIGKTCMKNVWKIEGPKEQKIVPIESVGCKTVPVKLRTNLYVRKMPNCFEVL